MQEEKTALVVEDEIPLSDAVKKKLELNHFKVATARTVEQALGYLEDLDKIDLIWLDHYLLGRENGLDFLTQVKKEGSKWRDVPVYVVSNTATPDKVKSYLRLGAKKYYTKSEHRLDEIISDIQNNLE